MAKTFDTTRLRHRERQRQVQTYGTQTPLSSTAVERGATRWLDGSRVDIEGILNLIGTMNASGVVDVTGTLNGSGTNNFDGTNNLSGENHLTGPTDVAGNFEIVSGGQFKAGQATINPDGSADFGSFGIESDGTLHVQNDLNVEMGGKIIAGQSTIEPTGKAIFGDFIIDPNSGFPIQAPGGKMFSNGNNQIGLTNDSGAVDLSPEVSRLSFGVSSIELTADGAQIWGQLNLPNVPSAAASGLVPLGIDTNGNVRRIA